MIRLLNGSLVLIFGWMAVPMALAQTDVSGSKDYPGISRMPGYYIRNYEETPFDSVTFTIAEGGKTKEQTVEGHRISLR